MARIAAFLLAVLLMVGPLLVASSAVKKALGATKGSVLSLVLALPTLLLLSTAVLLASVVVLRKLPRPEGKTLGFDRAPGWRQELGIGVAAGVMLPERRSAGCHARLVDPYTSGT